MKGFDMFRKQKEERRRKRFLDSLHRKYKDKIKALRAKKQQL